MVFHMVLHDYGPYEPRRKGRAYLTVRSWVSLKLLSCVSK